MYCSPYIIRGGQIEVYERGRACGGHGEKRIEYRIWWGNLMATDHLEDLIIDGRIAERTLEIDEELCVCFIDWQKAFDHVNWTKLMQILKRIGIDWRERRLISKLYVEQKVKV